VFIATYIKLAIRKYFFDLLKTTLKNMTFKVDNRFGIEGVLFKLEDGNPFLIIPHFHSVDYFLFVKARDE